jgi:hypothetical protein
LRVKNTAYFDIAAIPSTNGHLGFLHRPLVGGYAPTTRPTSEPIPVLAAKIRFGGNQQHRDTNRVTQRSPACSGSRGQGEPKWVAAGKADGPVPISPKDERAFRQQPTCGSPQNEQGTQEQGGG